MESPRTVSYISEINMFSISLPHVDRLQLKVNIKSKYPAIICMTGALLISFIFCSCDLKQFKRYCYY